MHHLHDRRTQDHSHFAPKWLVLLMCGSLVTGSWAAPAQVPLLNRSDLHPKPDVMLLLDDSGSMTYQYLPERSFTLNGVNVDFPNDGKVFLHPDEIPSRIFSARGFDNDVYFVSATLIDSEFDSNITKLNQMQMRSPQVNSIYYNPSVLYTPWLTSSGVQFPHATPTAANLDPMALDPSDATARAKANTKTVDLTAAAKTYNSVRWYCGSLAGAGNGDYSCMYPKTSPAYYTASSKSYNPGLVYILQDGADPSKTGNYKLYNINSAGGNTYLKAWHDRTDCTVVDTPATPGTAAVTTTTCSQDAERKNFANWFVYYRSRLHVAQGAIPNSFKDLTDGVRVGWGTIHSGSYTVDGQPSDIVQQGVRDLTGDHKNSLTQWLRSLSTYAQTPSKDAMISVGNYFSRTDNRSPWATDMENGTAQADQLRCRRAYNILVTDGYYRDSANKVGNEDGKSGYPFQDDNTNTLADVAMKFYANDLQPQSGTKNPDLVPPLPSDETDATLNRIKSDNLAFPHLNQFMIGLGVTGDLVTGDPALDNATLLKLAKCGDSSVAKADKTCWPTTSKPNEIDDLWHAAINARGSYFSVKNKDDLVNAFQKSLKISVGSPQKEAGLATSLPELVADNRKYVPQYTPVSWSGDIWAYSLNDLGKVTGDPLWKASEQRPPPDERHIFIWDSDQKLAYDFSGTLSSHSAGLIGSAMSTDLVNYLRGTNDARWTTYRRRDSTATLPDFVNSTPLYVAKGTNLGYSSLPTAANYDTYWQDKQSRTNGVLLVGGNGGMVHAFNTTNGRELFAFVPEAGLPKLSLITQLDYGSTINYHQYFADGPLIESDAYFALTPKGAPWWRNIVVGTMGAGGRSVYALLLNSTDATSLHPDPNSSDSNPVLWEKTSDDMGYITSEPQVGVLPNGKWKVFVGNGLESPNGHAALLMLDAADGTIQATPVSLKDEAKGNGLGGVALIRDSLKQVIGAYAGDNNGNLWRFDFAQDGSVTVGNNGTPIFIAKDSQNNPQPILSAPVIAEQATVTPGNLVIFNTGRLLYNDDSKAPLAMQTAYGVWDEQAGTASTVGAVPPAAAASGASAVASSTSATVATVPSLTRAALVQQTVTGVKSLLQTDGKSKIFYSSSSNPVVFNNRASTASPLVMGWYVDLDFPDITTPTLHHRPKGRHAPLTADSLVLISSDEPASNAETCGSTKGGGYALLIDALTGVRRSDVKLDTNGDGLITDADDAGVSGLAYGGGSERILTKPVSDGIVGSLQSADDGLMYKIFKQKQIIDRVWRQLLNPPQP